MTINCPDYRKIQVEIVVDGQAIMSYNGKPFDVFRAVADFKVWAKEELAQAENISIIIYN